MLDKEKIATVITHLVSNAVDAMAGGKEKTLRVITEKTSSEDGGFLRLMVADNGTGIKEENMARIFDPFFTTKEPEKGTGLGLSISHGIIQEHKGTFQVESAEGAGTSFTIQIPVVQPSRSNSAAA